MGKRATGVSFEGGVQHLLSHLTASLGKPRIPELSEMLNKYFRQSSRKKMESMSDYIVRKTDVYNRARQALSRVQQHYESGSQWKAQHGEPRYWQDNGWSYGRWHQWQSSWQQEHGPDPSEENDADGEPGQGEDADEAEEAEESRSREESYASGHGPSGSWSAYRGTSDSWSHTQEAEAWTLSTPELLPDFLQGWYMLTDSGLDSHEKNMIQTAIRGNFSVARVAQELRNQWVKMTFDVETRTPNMLASGKNQ